MLHRVNEVRVRGRRAAGAGLAEGSVGIVQRRGALAEILAVRFRQRAGDQPHDLLKPVRLILADGREAEPADFFQVEEQGYPEIGYRFYLEEKDLSGPLRLKLNDGTLTVRKKSDPAPATNSIRYFNTAHW